MTERIAADLIVIVHLGFIAFVCLGAFVSLRWKWVAWLQVPAASWGAAIELRHGICPLTPLEQRFRAAAGEAGYSGSFVDRYLLPIIYPSGLDEPIQYALGVLVIAVNLAVYGWIFLRRPHHAPDKP